MQLWALSSWVGAFSPATLTWIFMWNEWLHLWIVEFIALNRKTLKNVGFRQIFLLQRSCCVRCNLFLSFGASVPLSLAALSAPTMFSSVWTAASPELSSCCVLFQRAFVSFPFTASLAGCVEFPCYASITWFIFSLTFSIFPFSSPLLSAVLFGLFTMTLPDASFFY